MTTTQDIIPTTIPDLADWKRPGTLEIRTYINNWEALAGWDVEFSRSGSVRSAAVRGERISNNRTGQRICNMKAWISADRRLHTTASMDPSDRKALVAALVAAGLIGA